MAEAPTITWGGKSGKEYKYWIYDIGTTFTEVPGNYVFAKKAETGKFRPIYAGETEDLSARFDNHHKMPCIKENGATHICVHRNDDGEKARKAEEQDIIAQWHPICND